MLQKEVEKLPRKDHLKIFDKDLLTLRRKVDSLQASNDGEKLVNKMGAALTAKMETFVEKKDLLHRLSTLEKDLKPKIKDLQAEIPTL